ncbi:inactive poly [ADP-ribose] polymerase RCD1-like [Nymphaea colorata]|nr:inactive poly [ADP-ribose] polymerase RCD1-like [Nymphaea colorata]
MKGRKHCKVLSRRGMANGVSCTNLRKKPAGNVPVKCRSLLLNHLNFKNSGVPSRIMFFDHGSWTDFPAEAAGALVNGFVDGRPTMEIRIDGSMYLVDFLRMLQIDLGSGCERSIAWIDVNKKCFFPRYFLGEHADEHEKNSSCFKLEMEIRIDHSEGSKVGHEGDILGNDRISVASKTREQDCQLTMNQGACGGDVLERASQQKVRGLGIREEADEEKKIHADTYTGLNVRSQQLYLLNSGHAKRCLPAEVSCKDLACGNDKSSKVSPDLVKQVVVENFPNGGKNAAADMSGMGDKCFTRKRTLLDRTLKQLEDEPIDDPYLRKKACFEKGPSGIGAGVSTTKTEMVSNGFGDKTSWEIKGCSEDVCKGSGDVKDVDMHFVDAARMGTGAVSGFSHSHSGGIAQSGMKLLVEAIESKSDREPPSNACNAIPLLDANSGNFRCQSPPRFAALGAQLTKLEHDSKAYIKIKNVFLKGVGEIRPQITVKAIYWCSHRSPANTIRFLSFQRHIEAMKKSRGNANIKYGWHGASAHDIENIVLHGFGQPKTSCGLESYGVGIYLSPEWQSHLSLSYADPDENGEQHVILCRVILGNMEQVDRGSNQFHPSSENFDSGVDNVSNPRHYIVWSTHMNAHILPEYVLTFSRHDHLRGKCKGRSLIHDHGGASVNNNSPTEITNSAPNLLVQTIGPAGFHQASKSITGQTCKTDPCLITTRNMSFSKLFSFLEKHIPQPSIHILNNLYDQFKDGKVAKEFFIREIRLLIGDKLLIDAIHSIRNEV